MLLFNVENVRNIHIILIIHFVSNELTDYNQDDTTSDFYNSEIRELYIIDIFEQRAINQ